MTELDSNLKMTTQNNLISPHLNSLEYKSLENVTQILPYLEFIKVHTDGTILIGYSELTGRYWKGEIKTFNPTNDLKKITLKHANSIKLGSSTTDACFVGNSNKILTCEDSGTISLLSNSTIKPYNWHEIIAVSEHDSAVMALDCLSSEEKYISVGADGHIKIWNLSDMICILNYDTAHTNVITDIAVKPDSSNVFVTSSYDQTISLWNENVQNPLLDVIESDCGVRSVKWIDEHSVIFGSDAGALSTVDLRKPGVILQNIANLPAPIHKIIVKNQLKHVAVCGDNRRVSVYDISGVESRLLYKNNELHSNFVRGLAWDLTEDNILHAVGWDSSLNSHKYK